MGPLARPAVPCEACLIDIVVGDDDTGRNRAQAASRITGREEWAKERVDSAQASALGRGRSIAGCMLLY